MNDSAINLKHKLTLIDDYWKPRVITEMNDYQFKVVKVHGQFVWHNHADTDETFLVLAGNLKIELRDQVIELGPGELYVVKKGVEHRPVAEEEVHVLLIEPRGVINTGDTENSLTAEQDVWI